MCVQLSTEFLCTLCHRPVALDEFTEVRDIGEIGGRCCDGIVCPRCEYDRRVSGVDCVECRYLYAIEHGTVCLHCGGGLCSTCDERHDRKECASLGFEARHPGAAYGVLDGDFYNFRRERC